MTVYASAPLRNLITDPAWTYEDLGAPLPDDRHAVSVCLPTWDSVVDYEEGRDKVVKRLRCGYPRFFRHPAVGRLFAAASEQLAVDSERVVLFPHRAAAQRALRFVEKRTGAAARVVSYDGLQALIVPEAVYAVAMEYWRYTGEVVSSRQALDVLEGGGLWKYDSSELRQRVAGFGDYDAEDVFLYESGMSGVFSVFRAVTSLLPGRKTLQLDFPYVDVLKIQNHFGTGAVFLNDATGESFDEALKRIRDGEFAVVFCEVPSNPLLRTVDLARVSAACKEGGVPLAVDDTICSVLNVDVAQYADIVTTSLTKWISGKGDVMAGGVQLVKTSRFYGDLRAFFDDDCPEGCRLYAADAAVLDENSKGFRERMQPVNEAGEAIADFLVSHPAVDQVWYPKLSTTENYEVLRRENGGFGGLISFTIKNSKRSAKVFDSLQLSKGPSLGTEFSLACPYTLLAHYDELDWAGGCGVPSHLIRLSVGTEGSEILISKLEEALSEA
ncbi:cystathionine gamma-synthase [Rubritalea squalenifaciens DSM 18772]|uniref:Cystathionine gamma-synthase n=1 Tax=Rubritalea squalenifaciens DSM 18772 TaxID=1123071 RepID=A0A1M6I4W3_9BACT|nr:cystathionine gamma-synthase [Rubritalea squalenifaciens DSM 18772]